MKPAARPPQLIVGHVMRMMRRLVNAWSASALLLGGVLGTIGTAALVIRHDNGPEAAQDFVIDGIIYASLAFVLATLAASLSAAIALGRRLLRRRRQLS